MGFPLLTTKELKNELRGSGLHGLALDIDETLAKANHHWLEALLQRFGLPAGLTREEIMAKYWDKIENVPHWPQEKTREAAHDIFHSNDFQRTMPLIENANHAADAVHQVVPIVTYITARPTTVAKGTADWLGSHDFPEAPIVMKPLRAEFDFRNNWKASVLKYLYPEVVGIIDDNAGLVDELSEDYAGTVFIYAASDHPAASKNRVPCADWDSVVKAVREFASSRPD